MRPRVFIVAAVVAVAASAGVVSANRLNAHASTWQWRAATSAHAPQLLVSTQGVTLFGAGGPAVGQRLLVEADGRFVQTVDAAATDEAPVAAFVVADDDASETVVGVVRSDVARLILRGSDGSERDVSVNELGAFAAPSLRVGTGWRLDALAADGSLLSHLSLPEGSAPCGGPLGPCRTTTGGSPDSSSPASPLTTVATARAAGELWRLQTYFNRTAHPCVQVQGGGGSARTCAAGFTRPTSFGPVAGAEGRATAGWSRVWVFGQVAPSVRRMTLLRDCGGEVFDFPAGATTPRWFLRVYTAAQLRSGGLPRELSLRDAAGVLVKDVHLSPRLSSRSAAPSAGCRTRRAAWALSLARRTALQQTKTLPRAFTRAARPDDALPGARVFAHGLPVGPMQRYEPILATRRIASYVDGRGRRALLYLVRSRSSICTVLFWREGAGSGCNPSTDFFAGHHLLVGSGHLIDGVADDGVAKVVVVGSRGVRHVVRPTPDGGFIYDCKAYNGCVCVVAHVDAYNASGHLVERLQVHGSCRTTSSAAAREAYTIANRGRPVASRGNSAHMFPGHSYKLFLLGTAGGRAYYRVQVTAHFACWAGGPPSEVGKVGGIACPGVVGAYALQFDDNVVELRPGQPPGRHSGAPRFLRLSGIVADQAASVTLQDNKGAVIASVAPHENLYAFTPPFPRGFLHVVPLDARGKPLPPHPQWGEHQTPPPSLFGPTAVKVKPNTLGTVVQHGAARGVTVSVSQEGVVVFDTRATDPAARTALGSGNAWFSCFQINGQNVRHYRDVGISARLTPLVAFKSRGVKPQYDGCDAGGDYGHRWHDKYGPHSTIEIALTPQGARFVEDRATARDLAEFVRSAKTQAIRRLTGAALVAAIHRAYGDQVVVLASPSATASPGTVGVWTRGTRTIFSERSHLGDRLYVQFDAGKLTVNNVRGLAFVF